MHPLTGLIAAMPTPMRADLSLNLRPLEALADHAVKSGVSGVYIGSADGEFCSLTLEERQRLAAWWAEILKDRSLQLIVHVGHPCLADARQLAMHAEKIGADAVTAICPSFIKPNSVERLVACCETVAAAAPRVPFFLDDIPERTGSTLPMPEFLSLARKRIPTLGGMIYSSHDLAEFQECLCAAEDKQQILLGCEGMLLAGMALGARVGVGSTLAVAGPVYKRMFDCFLEGDLVSAQMEQARANELLSACRHFGFNSSVKAVMAMLGIECGPPRLPLAPLNPSQSTSLRNDLKRMEFFDWLGYYHADARKPLKGNLVGLALRKAA